MNEIIKKLRKHEIKIRQLISNRMLGNFHSIFKGSGIDFDELRTYQYGDDVRAIDWIVSAKGHGVFVKTFKEEKGQNVVFLVDVSASQEIGNNQVKKIDIAKEIFGILALAAAKEQSDVGLVCFSDEKELFVKAKKGDKHAMQLIKKIYDLKPVSKKTNINKSIEVLMSVLKKKSIIIIISDFIDTDYERNLKSIINRHDVVAIHLSDTKEVNFPKLGIIPITDIENNKSFWVNTFSKKFRNTMNHALKSQKDNLESLFSGVTSNYLWIDVQEEYISKLVQLFKIRNYNH